MSIIIYGAGGHARLLLEVMERSGIGPFAGFIDENPALHGTKIEGLPILGSLDKLPALIRVHRIQRAVIGVGDNAARRKLAAHARTLNLRMLSIVHPSAIISPSAHIGEGTVVLPGAIISAFARIGEANIINTRASVDHDCQTGDFVHIAPGATLCGGVTVGDNTLIGAGVTVIPEICIGDDTIIGAGATVICDIPSYSTAVGTPARIIATRTPNQVESHA